MAPQTTDNSCRKDRQQELLEDKWAVPFVEPKQYAADGRENSHQDSRYKYDPFGIDA
jgi:hypothetical protein